MARSSNQSWIGLAALAGAALWLSAPAVFASSGSGKDGVEDKVDDIVEDSVEDSVEDTVEDNVEDTVEDSVEDNVEDSVEDSVENNVEDSVEDDVEDNVEDNVEDSVEDNVEDSVESNVEDSVEGDVENNVEDNVESRIEGKIDDKVEDNSGPGELNDKVIDDQLDSKLESSSFDTSGSSKDEFDLAEEQAKLELEAARDAADAAYEAARLEARLAYEAALLLPGADKDALKAEYDLALDAAKLDYESSQESAESSYSSSREEIRMAESGAGDDSSGSGSSGSDGGENSGPGGGDDDEAEDRGGSEDDEASDGESDDEADDSGSGDDHESDENEEEDEDDHSGSEDGHESHSGKGSSNSGSGKSAGDDDDNAAAQSFELAYDEDGNEIGQGEWLVLAPPEAIGALTAQGYVARQIDQLNGLGLALVRLEAPASFDLSEAEAAIRSAAPDAEVAFNHVYRSSAEASPVARRGDRPDRLMPMPRGEDGSGHAIGVIDTRVDQTHPSLQSATLHVASFVGYENPQPLGHGTSVVSILAGASPEYHGLLPRAEIFAASVFFVGPDGEDAATTVGLVQALDWMAANHVPVVNMSLAGPDNAVLHRAIDSAYARGTVVVAAVGNAGPAAKPLYPAGYDHVVAVTAVSREKKIYRLANRGEFVDFAAPGVDVMHAAAGGSFAASSGTSMASPFVAAVLSVATEEFRPIGEATFREVASSAEDLGAKGRDPIYGYGLIRPLAQ